MASKCIWYGGGACVCVCAYRWPSWRVSWTFSFRALWAASIGASMRGLEFGTTYGDEEMVC